MSIPGNEGSEREEGYQIGGSIVPIKSSSQGDNDVGMSMG